MHKCTLVSEFRRGLSHFHLIGEEGINAIFEYGTLKVIEYIALDINTCCEELGYMKEVHEISNLMMTLFPKVPSGYKICDNLWEKRLKYDKDCLSVVKHFQDDMVTPSVPEKVVTPHHVSSYIAKLCHKINQGQ